MPIKSGGFAIWFFGMAWDVILNKIWASMGTGKAIWQPLYSLDVKPVSTYRQPGVMRGAISPVLLEYFPTLHPEGLNWVKPSLRPNGKSIIFIA